MSSVLALASLAGCATMEPVTMETVTSQPLVSNCPFPAPARAIDSERELVIRKLGVTEDPCRTTWNTACPAGSRAKWTFGHLMAVMSGAPGTTVEDQASNVIAQQFVGNWLKYWLSDQTVGSQVVRKRDNIRTQLLNHWLTDSGCAITADPAVCHLDLRAAPLRLLAIVNRIDMAGFDYSTGGAGTGELRFVFGVYNRAAATGPVVQVEPGAIVDAEVILEYRFPDTRQSIDWANRFRTLSDPSLTLADVPPSGFGTTSYADILQQQITDLVTGPSARPGNPNNGSSIGQIRVAEKAFDTKTGINATWEFRQFMLPCTSGSCQLAQVTVPQTPPTTSNPSRTEDDLTPLTAAQQAISNFIVANQNDISRSRHILPPELQGGSSIFLTNSATNLWATPNPVMTPDNNWNALIRHNFAFGTCNGCHYFETANEIGVFHIKPRLQGTSSALSTFLAGTGSPEGPLATTDNVTPTSYFQVPDPSGALDNENNAAYFHYNEPWRRACEVRRILTGSQLSYTTATGHGFDINLLAPPSRSMRDIAFNTTVPASDPGTLLSPGVLHSYDFNGKAGGIVTITMTGAGCGAPDTFVYLYGPKDVNGAFGLSLATSDDAGSAACGLDSQIKSFHLPATGNYLIVASSFQQAGSGHYSLQLTCENGACTP